MTGVYIGTSPLKAAYVGTTPVKEIYVGTTKVRPSGWQPGANTIAYYKFVNDILDYSGNGKNLTGTGTFSDNMITTTTLVYYNGTDLFGRNYSGNFAFSMWVDLDVSASNASVCAARDNVGNPVLQLTCGGTSGQYTLFDANNSWAGSSNWNFTKSGIHHFVIVRDNNILSFYKDGVVNATTVSCSGNMGGGQANRLNGPKFGRDAGMNYAQIRLGEVIIENKVRTDQEVLDYYKSTKSNYGL